jgi:hypothetical protein
LLYITASGCPFLPKLLCNYASCLAFKANIGQKAKADFCRKNFFVLLKTDLKTDLNTDLKAFKNIDV